MAFTNPKSRKIKELKRKEMRKEKLLKAQRSFKKNKMDPVADRMTWIQLYIPGYLEEIGRSTLQKEDITEIFYRYIARNDDEIHENEQNGKRESLRLKNMRLVREIERKELLSGLLLPDLTDEKIFALFQQWDGDYNGIKSFKTIKIQK
eukprot:GHVN01040700.1.p1 GENE.GHVN01040700.1~~GHVN01040700.1.p1  ORF type:complete len:149 (+),score=14.74 GHVN01040700.1:2-448(+)